MPTNLYGPNDNLDLEKSHVLPALVRKIQLGKALEEDDWVTIRSDLKKLPIEGIDDNATKDEILSIFNKYGIRKAETKVQVEIWGSGKPRREFLWSEDMADACVFLMEKRNFNDTYKRLDASNTDTIDNLANINNQEIRNTHINIGTGIDISIKELAEMIKEIINFQGELYFNAEKPDGTLKKLTDVTKLTDLGWKHTVDLQQGIEKIVYWYKGRI